MEDAEHRFGGPWTEEKLTKVAKYLRAYTAALKNKGFQLVYIDAFAGTGYRGSKSSSAAARGFFPIPEMAELAKGSARRALDVQPAYDRYVFVEANQGRFQQLKRLEDEFPLLAGRMAFRNEDANTAIANVCASTDWRRSRAVLFLDPYGMKVNWETIEIIGRTRYIDLWYLFPVGTVQRLLQKEGKIPLGWKDRLDRFLGDTGWRTKFYDTVQQTTLFEAQTVQNKVANVATIESHVRDRLRQVFLGGVARAALQLRNRKGSCMYLLFFACGNPSERASRLALKIAQDVLRS